MNWRPRSTWITLLLSIFLWSECLRADVTILGPDRPGAVIHVSAAVMQTAAAAAAQRHRRLRESVNDLSHYLEKIAGAPVEIVTGPPRPADRRMPILVGDLATSRFGPPRRHAPGDQALRIVVTREAVGLIGESDLATSYAIYELLDQLGCRWYMPGAMGEVIPRLDAITIREQDVELGPYTYQRNIWHADEAYRRRNRLGGLELHTGHALEGYVSAALLEKHPEWRAVAADGKHHGRRLRWSAPGVAEAIAARIVEILDENPSRSTISLSPDDGPANGMGFDMTDDRALDAGDHDSTTGGISHTDRLVWICNRVATLVTSRHADVRFGMLAYRNYTRPPLREKLHPNIVPQIAPLSYSRAHPWTDSGEPNNESMRAVVRRWAAAAKAVSYYAYGYFWPELSTPNPFITKWSVNVPMALGEGNCRFWQPETLPNFDTTMHAIYLGIRLAWDPDRDPAAIIDELHERFYGRAAGAMSEYWHFIDRCWVETPEYSGGGYGHLRRFTPERMATARGFVNTALGVVSTPEERFRVTMADESLRLFELFMKMRRDLAAGRFETLANDARRWRQRASTLADTYRPQYAFGRVPWDEGNSIYGRLFKKLYQRTYEDASRIAKKFTILTRPPLRSWRFRIDPEDRGDTAGWAAPGFDDSHWQLTDPCLETMSTLGHHDHRGVIWERARVFLATLPAGTRVLLWIGGVFDEVQPFINGTPLERFRSRGWPRSWDITETITSGAENQITLRCVRGKGRHGLGGLVAPVVIYRDGQSGR